jgi:hypothetical protein
LGEADQGLAGGAVLTGTDTLNLHGESLWTGGTMAGSGRTLVPVGITLTINNSSDIALNGRTLENGGTVAWTGTANLFLSSALITNRPGALFQAQNSRQLNVFGGSSRFDNAGTFRKSVNSGAMTFGSSVNFNNYATVEIHSGVLRLAGGGVNTGTFALPAGTKLELAGGTFSSSAGRALRAVPVN